MKRRIPATTAQHQAAAGRLLEMRRQLVQALRDLGVVHGTPHEESVTAKETDALLTLDRAIQRCAVALEVRMKLDGHRPPADWSYFAQP